jgi:hypothetical protein
MKRILNLSARGCASVVMGLLLGLAVGGCGPAETVTVAGVQEGSTAPAVSAPAATKTNSSKSGGPVTRRELQKERRAKAKGQS